VITIGASDGTDGRRLRAQSKCPVYSQVILPRVLLENVFFILYLNFVLYKYHFIAISIESCDCCKYHISS
jgi:hypothetical protein